MSLRSLLCHSRAACPAPARSTLTRSTVRLSGSSMRSSRTTSRGTRRAGRQRLVERRRASRPGVQQGQAQKLEVEGGSLFSRPCRLLTAPPSRRSCARSRSTVVVVCCRLLPLPPLMSQAQAASGTCTSIALAVVRNWQPLSASGKAELEARTGTITLSQASSSSDIVCHCSDSLVTVVVDSPTRGRDHWHSTGSESESVSP